MDNGGEGDDGDWEFKVLKGNEFSKNLTCRDV